MTSPNESSAKERVGIARPLILAVVIASLIAGIVFVRVIDPRAPAIAFASLSQRVSSAG